MLAKAFGADGVRKRAKLQVLREAVNGEWSEGGTSLKGTLEFLDRI